MIETLPHILKVVALVCAGGAVLLWIAQRINRRWSCTANSRQPVRHTKKEQFGGWSKLGGAK